ncbi:ABC transporter permease [Corynebacterium uterequi]|uniref:FtsX-like permease family n=1 Tax=Corynebacterium uterequi TaxID=1072256 RepID=A0A0G3HDY7_9CORY|nr:FtsX-like permease family protein [Corynebacterium uterequi]AKK11529.1 FtsX-like permease family [Corynebacterium uterequi]
MRALAAVIRPSVRDAVRHPLKLLFAVLMVALPAFVLSVAATITQSESHPNVMSTAPVEVRFSGNTCVQNPYDFEYRCTPVDPEAKPTSQLDRLQRALPAGWTAETSAFLYPELTFGNVSIPTTVTQLTPAALAERLPFTLHAGEIVLAHYEAETLGVSVGDTVTATLDGRKPVDLTVVALSPNIETIVAEPSLVDPSHITTSEDFDDELSFGLFGGTDLTYEEFQALNNAGFAVVLPVEVTDAPGLDELPPGVPRSENAAWPIISAVETVFLMLLAAMIPLSFGIVLTAIIIPVFSATAARRAQDFALMISQGARRWHIHVAVMTYGVVVGLTAAVLAIPSGTAVGVWRFNSENPGWPPAIDWWGLVGIFALCVGGSLIASLLPAYLATRGATSATIEGSRPDRLLRFRAPMLVGPIVTIAAVAGFAVSALTPASTIVGNLSLVRFFLVVLVLLGLLASGPLVVFALSRLTARAKLAPRLAAREASRNALRTAPAVSAVMAVAFFATWLTGAAETLAVRDAHTVGRVIPSNVLVVEGELSAAQRDLISEHLGEVTPVPLTGIAASDDNGDPQIISVPQPVDPDYYPLDSGALLLGSAIIGTDDVVNALAFPTELDREGARAALDTGGIVVAEGASNGENTVEFYVSNGEHMPPPRSADAPVAPVGAANLGTPIISEELARALDAKVVDLGTAFIASEPISEADYRALKAAGIPGTTSAAIGLPSTIVGFLLAAVVAFITIVLMWLSREQIRDDLGLMAAVGASPSLGSRLGAYYGAGIAAVGGAIGWLVATAAGALNLEPDVVVNEVTVYTGQGGFFRPDWALAVGLVVVAPAAAAVAGWLMYRRLPAICTTRQRGE